MRLISEMSVSSSQKSSFEHKISTIKFQKKHGGYFGGGGPRPFPYLSTTLVHWELLRAYYLIRKKSITFFNQDVLKIIQSLHVLKS